MTVAGVASVDVVVDGDLAALLRALVADAPGAWSVREDEAWAHADNAAPLPSQGWKLHVSSTVLDAGRALRACAGVLLDAGCQFKVARDLNQVEILTSPHCPRGNAGKIITAYPADDAQAVALAQLLDQATGGLRGPRILTDSPLHPGSLVHYRYGVFTGVPTVSHDGEVSHALLAPDGTVVPDRREAGFAAPGWARSPFRQQTQPAATAATPQSREVLLGDRFAVREAIRHANRGGVFRATDTVTGHAVVVKQARAHVGADTRGYDVRDRLRNEARVLEFLAVTGAVPELVDVFEQSGDLFVAEQDLGGVSLRSWVTAGMADGTVLRTLNETRRLLCHLAELVATVHRSGVTVRDLSPNNVVVTDDLRPVLIDLEFGALPGVDPDLLGRGGTPAYGAPEQFTGAVPGPSADSFALGAVILFAFTGEDPYLSGIGPSTLAGWLRHGPRRGAVPDSIAELALALCAAEPAARLTVAAAAGALARPLAVVVAPASAGSASAAFDDLDPISDYVADAAIETLTDRLLLDVQPVGARVAPSTPFGQTTLATTVQHGAAGILGVLVQAWRIRRDDRLLQRIDSLAGWLDRAGRRPLAAGPVGLYFGLAGPCWALADAGVVLRDDSLVERALTRALALPRDWPGPDVTHGIAGLGLTLIHLWQVTGDPRPRDAVSQIATRLIETAEFDGADVSWRTPCEVQSSFAGQRFYGFAHGIAGIALFLDHAAVLTGREDCAAMARAGAATLRGAALAADGLVKWGSGPDEPTPGLPHWCNGSSGVATFLLRHAGGANEAELLEGAARATVAAKWQSGIAYCHGLSGNADLLLDLSDSGATRYREWAADLLRIMWNRRSSDARGTGLTDEPGYITPDFNVGYGGALSALLRLRHGGPRLWLPECAA